METAIQVKDLSRNFLIKTAKFLYSKTSRLNIGRVFLDFTRELKKDTNDFINICANSQWPKKMLLNINHFNNRLFLEFLNPDRSIFLSMQVKNYNPANFAGFSQNFPEKENCSIRFFITIDDKIIIKKGCQQNKIEASQLSVTYFSPVNPLQSNWRKYTPVPVLQWPPLPGNLCFF